MSLTRHIQLFGALHVTEGKRVLNMGSGRAASLLAYLVLHPHTRHTRERLAEILSPDTSPERVRRNFSDALYRLRSTLGARWLAIEGETLALNSGPDLWVDVWEFERLAARQDLAALETAAALYKGDLLPEIYDDWILLPRLALQEKYFSILESLAAEYEAQNDLPRALSYARQLISADPLRESAQQTFLRLLGRLKRRAQALAHYEYVRQLFQTELGVEPLAETQTLVEAIQREAETAPTTPFVIERTRFVGRTLERARGVERIEQTLAGHGGLLSIEGEAGIGKSRLLRELALSAQWRGATTAYGAANEYPSASPFSPIADALQSFLHRTGATKLENLIPSETLAALGSLYAPWRALAVLPELPPVQARQRFQHSFINLMQTLARRAPLVLMLDDLHWADAALWDLLDALAPHASTSPLLLLLAYRRPEIERNAGWEVLQRWERAGYLKTITLQPLNVQEVSQLLPTAERVDAARVFALTGGNPFYITEYLSREADAPNLDPIRTRTSTLSASARAALEAAAVLGEHVAFRLWSVVAQASPVALAAASEELTNRYLVQPTDAGYAFAHDVIRAAVYDQIKPVQRRELHSRAADALATFDPENWRARAFHLERAERRAEAAEAYQRAGAQALAQFAFRDAQTALEHSLTLLPPTPSQARIEAELALARALDALGNRAQQAEVLAQARADARALQHQALLLQALVLSGRVTTLSGQVVQAAAMYDEALALARTLGDARQEFEVLFWRGDLAMRRGELNDARVFYGQALALARQTANRQGEARALRGMGTLTRQEGDPEKALELHHQALAIHRELRDMYSEAVTMLNVLGSLYDLGAWDRLLTTARETIALCESLDHYPGVGVARHLLSLGAYAIGDYETARELLPQVAVDFQATGDRRNVGLTWNTLGLVEFDAGNVERARELYLQALAIAREIQAATERGYVLHDLGVLCLTTGEAETARDHLAAACEIWKEQGNLFLQRKSEAYLGLAYLALNERARAMALAEQGLASLRGDALRGELPQGWHWALYRLLHGLHRPADAHAALRAAYQEVQRQGLAIGDHAMRQRFFERVPLNRAILTAYEENIAATQTRLVVTLARCDAPLGRSLQPSERVTVHWTVNAPEDEAIRGKTARRRHRLQRLLAEAHAQNAAPTDEDLARALGVSRHTILRDMATLAKRGEKTSTRKRKAVRNT
ncbi:MAG: AAA family ATPase [Anaerolineae bacterium]|nr:AAA family ATPase [Anaerolineae bacterium]